MSDLERRLEQELERLAIPVSMPAEAKERVMTRSTRRRIVLPTVAACAVVILSGGIFATAGKLWDTRSPQDPAGHEKSGHRCLGERATIVGTPGDDKLEGTRGHDVIMGLGGNDEIDGLDGDDYICGGPGSDRIDAGDGSDEVWGGPGSDDLRGGAGLHDGLDFGGATGGVTVHLAFGVASGEGDDSVAGFEEVWGSSYDDLIRGSSSDDHLEGGGGDDQIYGLGGNDEIFPGDGDDVVVGGPGEDIFGFEFLVGPLDVNLAEGEASGEGDDDLLGIEVVIGSQFDDVFVGSDADESFKGLGGNDSIDGGAGEDEIDGGPGDDTCTNGEQLRDC